MIEPKQKMEPLTPYCRICGCKSSSVEMKYFTDKRLLYICAMGLELGGRKEFKPRQRVDSIFAMCSFHYSESLIYIADYLDLNPSNICKMDVPEEKWIFLENILLRKQYLFPSRIDSRERIIRYIRKGFESNAMTDARSFKISLGYSNILTQSFFYDDKVDKLSVPSTSKTDQEVNISGNSESKEPFDSLYHSLHKCIDKTTYAFDVYRAALNIINEPNLKLREKAIKKLVCVNGRDIFEFNRQYEIISTLSNQHARQLLFTTNELQNAIVSYRLNNVSNCDNLKQVDDRSKTTDLYDSSDINLQEPDITKASRYLRQVFNLPEPFVISPNILDDWLCPHTGSLIQLRSFLFHILQKITSPRSAIKDYSSRSGANYLPTKIIRLLFDLALIVFGLNQYEVAKDMDLGKLRSSAFFKTLGDTNVERMDTLKNLKRLRYRWENFDIKAQLDNVLEEIKFIDITDDIQNHTNHDGNENRKRKMNEDIFEDEKDVCIGFEEL